MKISMLVYRKHEDGTSEWKMVFEGAEVAPLRIQKKQADLIVRNFTKGYSLQDVKTHKLTYIEYLSKA